MKTKVRTISLLLLILLGINVKPQEKLNVLIDSLSTGAITNENAVELALKITDKLKLTDWHRAERYLEIAKKKAEQSKSPELEAEFYKNAAKIYYDRDAFDVSLNYNLKAYDFYKNKFPCEQNEIENLLAVIYARLNNESKALYYFKRVYAFHKEQDNSVATAQILNNIGSTFLNFQRPDSALIYLKQSIPILKKAEDYNSLVRVYTSMARAYGEQSDLENAEAYFRKAMDEAEKLKDAELFHFVYFSVAQYHLEKGHPQLAADYAQKAMALNIEKYSFNNMIVLELLYEAYNELDNYKEASHYFREYNEIRDSLNIEEKAFNVEKQRIEYEFKARQEISRLNERQNHLILIIVILGLVVILLISGVFLIRYKNKLVKEKLKNELNIYRERELKNLIELKDKELATKTIVETKREEIYNSILKDLRLAHLKTGRGETKEILDNVLSKLESNTNKAAWEEFEMRFTKVYESFYRNLSEKHPKLSVYDKRVCALIRLNLTTKEIADLTGVTVRSVENTRTRLRKKLNLTNKKVDIAQYLSEF